MKPSKTGIVFECDSVVMLGKDWAVYDELMDWVGQCFVDGERTKASKIQRIADKFLMTHRRTA